MPAGPSMGQPASPMSGSPYMTAPRGPSSRDELEIQWQYPVFVAEQKDDGERTQAVQAKRALPLDEAFAYLAGDDPRPLLVLRECLTCNGTDDALLTRQADNERTMLLTRWFHCVKLPPAVLEADHPFHALFADEAPPHLFVAQRDGRGRVDLKGDQSRSELWKAMDGTLAVAYQQVTSSGPKRALGELNKLLDKLDAVDDEFLLTERRLEDEIEESGPDGRKAKKLAKELVSLKEERAELRAKALKVSTLKLRAPEDLEKALEKAYGAPKKG